MPNYVVLHHQPNAGKPLPRGANAHFDWMFDQGAVLWTWATDTLPDRARESTLPAIRLQDHRRLYLAFEGSLGTRTLGEDGLGESGLGDGGLGEGEDRGKVHRVESGSFETVRAEMDHYEFAVSGARRGIVMFQRTLSVLNGDDVWYWSFRPVLAEAS